MSHVEFKATSWEANVGDRKISISTNDHVHFYWSFNSRFGRFSGTAPHLEIAKGHAIDAFAYQGTLEAPKHDGMDTAPSEASVGYAKFPSARLSNDMGGSSERPQRG